MLKDLRINNSLSGKKELFEPIHAPFVGMYVCGPTVYSDVHLGNVRTFVSFDIIYRYLLHLGYKVRYVRNITDVGHLVNDADAGEDKIAKKAKLENIEPMEVVQRYTQDFHRVMDQFNALPPSIEPSATGHILEQIELIELLIEKGLAYEVNGSVYFDVKAYQKDHNYGKLSGRKIEDLLSNTRALDGQDEKRESVDFALWKSAVGTDHIMRWKSPWSDGFPGWHLECTVMGTKYLGKTFDIHGGGMDLKFPHHECELAQSVGAHGHDPVKYWLHTNMLTVNGQKMSKSLNNSFLPHELFSGDHELLERPYSPMTVRFFMLQSHYASTLDFSNDALLAAQKGYRKLMNGLKTLRNLHVNEGEDATPNEKATAQINQICDNCYRAMNDDFNTALTLGHLFNLLKKINNLHTQNLTISQIGQEAFDRMKHTYKTFVLEILGLKEESNLDIDGLMDIVIKEYAAAKEAKNYDKVDVLRSSLKSQGIVLKDMKSGIDWAYEE
ncbi:cysteinyl-tRNA synthetase [Reichenbachiella agariperforans]|uniref:Cysteine--tRNA ligase n=1 Tax=Reichenbachiella agariperforans TaxID=156994 RepID=A0A1M6TY59_REIAG|nr:cysteine--tRNA ligase [Reichenbachiella agariperforans]SHK61824.1 cysteinyl-tRNA synthetase [Reichenbachiella agariperforans]